MYPRIIHARYREITPKVFASASPGLRFGNSLEKRNLLDGPAFPIHYISAARKIDFNSEVK
jgi:hypothetical protein